jgi:hypothetical protein
MRISARRGVTEHTCARSIAGRQKQENAFSHGQRCGIDVVMTVRQILQG